MLEQILKISFSKILAAPTPFETRLNGVIFSGNLSKISADLIKCEAKILGILAHRCDRCGSDLNLELNENLSLNLSNGIYKDRENSLSDTIEIFGGEIDINELLKGEIEAFKSDYFYCQNCKI